MRDKKGKIVILDFGGQYDQLIARRVRESGTYCELYPHSAPKEGWLTQDVRGVILTGGPQSVNAQGAAMLSADELLSYRVPVLGICYGMQVICKAFSGIVGKGGAGEYGGAELRVMGGRLFENVQRKTRVYMNHFDAVMESPAGFSADAGTQDCPVAAFSDDSRGLYGVQFHPEVVHSDEGKTVLRNFIRNICGCKGDYAADAQVPEMISEIRAQVGDGLVVAGLSGGVDSTVACTLTNQALRPGQLQCVFVNHGLLRQNEAEDVLKAYRTLGLSVTYVDAEERFLSALKGVTEPEQKRKIIGREFVRVFEEEAKKSGARFLLQGTIYPDRIESGMGGSATIKSHHNVGGLPTDSLFKPENIVEPLRMLFKDEVRMVGRALNVPEKLVARQPFPGPGLGVRVMGELTREKLDILRACDAIYLDELEKAGLMPSIWQAFAVLTDTRTVGVMGDERTYGRLVALRAVTTEDGMTAEAGEIPYAVLKKAASRIINHVRGVNRVVYDITGKPPGTIEWE